ncbi:MAG: Nif3-like dinuclear metal center hexameric protein [Planctomycetales bacterium]
MPLLADLIRTLDELAPASLAESWDNTGLLLGDAARGVKKILTCLTLTEDVAQEAISEGADLIVTHHPVMFRPIQKLTTGDAQGRILLGLAREGIAVFSPHTRYDNAPRGINQQLAEACGLEGIRPLRTAAAATHYQLVTFVPPENLSAVRQALWSAGAGQIGEYACCSYSVQGVGTFLGSENSQPQVGTKGHLEEVGESRLEVLVSAGTLGPVIEALRKTHPYEEPAYFVYPLHEAAGTGGVMGAGRVGDFAQPRTVGEVADKLCAALKIQAVQIVGDAGRLVSRVGIACGAAAEFLKEAHAAGCRLFITGEARFHDALLARDLGVAVILLGHYGSERTGMERMVGLLQEKHPDISIWASRAEHDPIQWYVPPSVE